MFGTHLVQGVLSFHGVVHINGNTSDGLSTGFQVPSGHPLVITSAQFRHGPVTLYDFKALAVEEFAVITAVDDSW